MMSAINGSSAYKNTYISPQDPQVSKDDKTSEARIKPKEGVPSPTKEVENSLPLSSPEELQSQMMAQGANKPASPPSGGKTTAKQEGATAPTGLTSTNNSSTVTDSSSSDLLETLTTSTSTYTAAEIAEYDTNGDGTIDTAEEAIMKLAQAEALEASKDSKGGLQVKDTPVSKQMQEAITAYTQKVQSDTTSQFDKVVA